MLRRFVIAHAAPTIMPRIGIRHMWRFNRPSGKDLSTQRREICARSARYKDRPTASEYAISIMPALAIWRVSCRVNCTTTG